MLRSDPTATGGRDRGSFLLRNPGRMAGNRARGSFLLRNPGSSGLLTCSRGRGFFPLSPGPRHPVHEVLPLHKGVEHGVTHGLPLLLARHAHAARVGVG